MERRKRHIGQDSELKARLTDYSALTRISAAAQTLRRRTGNWPIYAAAAGSALAMATSASASVITAPYQGGGPVAGGASVKTHADASSVKGLLLGFCASSASAKPSCLNPEGLFGHTFGGLVFFDELNIHASAGFPAVSASAFNPIRIFGANSNPSLARNFAAGATIGPGVPHAGQLKIAASFTAGPGVYGNFLPGQAGYLGFSASNGGIQNFGWIKLIVSGTPGKSQPILEALSFGLETNSGESILAGQTVEAAPEPGTLALSILAAGAAGVLALKRRRQQKTVE